MKRILVVLYVLMGSLVYASPDSTSAQQEISKPQDVEVKKLTPIDQVDGSSNDVEITRRIRQGLLEDSSLSLNAQNVKVITIDEKVTIRGSVENNKELERVLRIARNQTGNRLRISHDVNVLNQ